MTKTNLISVEGLAKRFPTPDGKGETEIFADLWFGIEEGEFVCLIGHSGCGKTTMLNILAGLDEASAGAVIVGNKEVTGTSLDRAVVFQTHALLPWMTAMRNIAFAVDDLPAALQEMQASGISLIDAHPRQGAEGLHIAFLHPKSTHGVLTELCAHR